MKINCLILSDDAKNLALIKSTLAKYCTPDLIIFQADAGIREDDLLGFCPHIAILDMMNSSAEITKVINRFRHANPETYFIEFVQYREFSFSQRIMPLDNVDYLPRPVQTELLQESVTRIVNEIYQREISISDDLQTVVNDNIPVIRQHYLSLLMRRGGYDHAVIMKKFRTLQIDCKGPYYTVVIADMPGEKDKQNYEAISFLVLSSMKSLLKSNGYQVYTFFDSEYRINCLIGHESKKQRESICDLLVRFRRYCLLYIDVQLLIGVGKVVDSTSDIHASFDAGMLALQHDKAEALINTNRKMKGVKEYIENNLSDPKLGLDCVSRYFGFSRSYFSRLFRKEQGMGFSEYLQLRRIEKAKELLSKSDMQVKDVAKCVGFSTSRYFSTTFRDTVGVSPGAYRAQMTMESKLLR